MSIYTLAATQSHKLRFGTDAVASWCFRKVQQRCVGTPEEPDWVAGLVLLGTRRFAHHWRKVLAPYQISVTGIFCHQRPKVEFAGHKRCELGDILWAHEHTDRHGVTHRRALLLQVKMSPGVPHPIKNQEPIQFELYEQWPQFEYYQRPLKGQKRQVTPGQPHLGAHFLLLDDPMPILTRTPWYPPQAHARTCQVQPTLTSPLTLGQALGRLLAASSGRPYADLATARLGTDWDAVVWDLIQVSANKTFPRKNANWFKQPRNVSYLARLSGLSFTVGSPSPTIRAILGLDAADALVAAGEVDFELPQGEWHPSREFDGDDEGGIPIILIETRDPGALELD